MNLSDSNEHNLASYSNTRFSLDKNRDIVWSVFAPHLEKKFKLEGAILDLGCGYGSFINHVNTKATRYAMDLNSDMKKYVNSDVQFYTGGVDQLCQNFGRGELDVVFSSNLLEHLSRESLSQLFKDINLVLRPGGVFIIFMPNYRLAANVYFDDYTHITPLSDRSLSDWLEASGFEISFCHPGYMPYSVKDSKLPIHPLLIQLWLAMPFKFGGKQMLLKAVKPDLKKAT